MTLVVQQAGAVDAGFAGKFISESVMFFSQSSREGPLRFRAIGVAPNRFKSQAKDGQLQSVGDWLAVAKEVLSEWSPQSALKRSHSDSPSRSNDVGMDGLEQQRVSAPALLARTPEVTTALAERFSWLSVCLEQATLALGSAACGICAEKARPNNVAQRLPSLDKVAA